MPGRRRGRRARLRRRRPRRQRGDRAAHRRHARRSRLDHLHLGHHRPAEGLRADPPLLRHRGRRAAGAARGVLQRRHVDAAVPADRARLRPGHPDRRAGRRLHPGPHAGRVEPARGPRRLRADLRARRPAGVREGLQRRQAARAQRRQGHDLRPRRVGGDPVLRGARHRRAVAAAAAGARAVRPAGLRQAPRGAGRQLRGGGLRRRAAGGAPRALLPRHGGDDLRGVRPHRDHSRDHRQPPRRDQDRHRRAPGRRRHCARRRGRRAAVQPLPTSSAATGRTPTPPPRPSSPTAGSTPATSARSTRTGSSASPAARRN